MSVKKSGMFLLCLFTVWTAMLSFLPLQSALPSTQKLQWLKYDEALKLAKKSQKYVLVEFMAEWCGYCKLMQETTYEDPGVLDMLKKKFVLARVDIESERSIHFKGENITEADLSMYYEVTGTPTTWFFDSLGNAIIPLPGYVDAGRFHAILKYIATGSYKKMKFRDFVKKNGM